MGFHRDTEFGVESNQFVLRLAGHFLGQHEHLMRIFPPNIHLTGGDTYRLEVAVGGDDSSFGWAFNTTGVLGRFAADPGFYRTAINPIGAFDVLGVPEGPPFVTPLPSALPLFATGLGALGLLAWRRKRKTQAAA
jgi:hypothetical protein